jgi:hypothetical protein
MTIRNSSQVEECRWQRNGSGFYKLLGFPDSNKIGG